MFSSQISSLFLLLMTVTAFAVVLGQEEILMNYVHTDQAWQWVTKYRLAAGNGWARDSQTGKYTTCDIPSTKTNSTNSWMVSDYIPLNNANSAHLSITFTARQCNLILFPFCKDSIGLYTLESDVIKLGGVAMEAILAGKFSMVANATASNVWSDRNNIPENVYNVSFPVTKKGVYVAFRDIGACVALVKVRMTSYHCPSVVSGGAVFNKTGSPMPSNQTKVMGECLGMSENLANGSSLHLSCYSNGTWSSNLRVTCQCKAGYQPGDRVCQACPAGSYKPTTGNTMCISCPSNSYSNTTRTGCVCNLGYYRTPTDPENSKCTAPPSPPRELSSNLIGPRFILLSWQRPLNDGGRNDLLYSIACYRCNYDNARDYNISRNVSCNQSCESTLRYTPSANRIPFTHVTIYGLVPGSNYSFRITVVNGVSGLGGNVTNDYEEVSTSIPQPAVPKLFVSFVGSDSTVLSWSSKEDNPSLSFFYYSISCALCDKESSDCVTSCNKACGNAIQYQPRKDQIEGSFAVVSQLKESTKYKFTLSVTERDSDGYRSDAPVVCVTTKNTGDAAQSNSNGQQDRSKELSLFSKIALGVSGGFLLLAVILLVATVCLRNKWYKDAKTMQNGSSATMFSYNNELKPIENLVIMEETNLEYVRRK